MSDGAVSLTGDRFDLPFPSLPLEDVVNWFTKPSDGVGWESGGVEPALNQSQFV